MELTLIRGCPGAGKSTLAKKLMNNNSAHYEADMFWKLFDGTYRFDFKKLTYAHQWCLSNVAAEFESQDVAKVIVSNTFTTTSEIMPYITLAEVYKVPVKIINVRTQFKSVHDVPEATIEKMKNRWQEIPDNWNCVVENILN
jgi:tRNA uridine 5-carbamoylmethylation protein Kti12